jgi:hypothetical protein
MKLLGTISVDFDVTDQLLIRFFAFVRYWKKSGVEEDDVGGTCGTDRREEERL